MYNPRLSWLNQRPRLVLLGMYITAFPWADLEHAGLMTIDQLKSDLLEWAEGRHGVASLEGLETG